MRRIRRLAALGILLAGGALLGCSEDDRGLRTPAVRFADAGRGPDGQPPRATIANDTRSVLAAPPRFLLAYRMSLTPDAAGQVAVDLDPLDAPQDSAGLVLETRVRAGGPWQALPARWSAIRATDAGRRVPLELVVPGATPGEPVEMIVDAWLAPPAHTRHQTTAVDVAVDATVLRFSTGVLAAAREQGPVRFAVSACRGDDCTVIFDETLDPAAETGWRDSRVPLGSVAAVADRGDGPWSFRFETEHVGAGPDRFTLAVWGNPTLEVRRDAPDPPPNLILVSIDTLRADHLGSYGYARDTSPFLDREIAARGTLFESLVAEAAATGPSHMSMFTSFPATIHGVTGQLNKLQVPVPTLAEVLHADGFETAAFTENGPLAQARGFGRGFDSYSENKSANEMRPVGHVDATLQQGREWIERHRDARFFVFLHTFQVHHPYTPPPDYATYFRDGKITISLPDDDKRRGAEKLSAEYDREIRYVDDQLAAFYGWLSNEGLADRTLLVVTSDHGEEFFEHGGRGHRTLPYEQVLRVPLLLRGPGVPEGRRVAATVSHIDLMPTLLDVLGVAAPEGLRGESFAAHLAEEPLGAVREERPIFSASWAVPADYQEPAHTVRLGTRKLIRFRKADGSESFAYYDLASDPDERVDRYRPGVAADLVSLLSASDAEALEVRARLGRASAGPAQIELDPEREQKLRALGYID